MATRRTQESWKENGDPAKVKELEIHKLNEEIQRLRAFAESLIQSISSGLILVDTREQITFFNRAADAGA